MKIKKDRFTCDNWTVITDKTYTQKEIHNDVFDGYVSLLELNKVSKPQIWDINGEKITVCDNEMKWIRILPKEVDYTIMAIFNKKNEIQVCYIDLIDGYGIDIDGIVYVNDMFLDLIIYSDGYAKIDDMDELEQALNEKVITEEMYNNVLKTCKELKRNIQNNINKFNNYCVDILNMMIENK